LKTYLLTYLLTPWSRVLLEKLTGSAASQEIPRFFGTRRFITVLTSPRHLSLSWANSIQSPPPPPTYWRFILILSSHLRLDLESKGFVASITTYAGKLWRFWFNFIFALFFLVWTLHNLFEKGRQRLCLNAEESNARAAFSLSW